MLDSKYDKLADVYALYCSITADATGEKTVPIPFACEVIDVIVQARATNGGGTATLKKGSNAITDAIAMAQDTTIARAGTINDAYSTLAEGDAVSVDAAGAADRGLVTILVRRL
jgi:hypothetical protein